MRDVPLWQMVSGVVGAIAAVVSGAWALENHWTPREMFVDSQKQYREERNIDLLDRTNDRLWDIEQRQKKDPGNEDLEKQKRDLEERKKRLEKKLEVGA